MPSLFTRPHLVQVDGASAEILPEGSFLVRVHGEGHRYGDKYDFACVFIPIGLGLVEARGALRAPTPSEWRLIYKLLVKMGIRKVSWVRQNGKIRHVRLSSPESKEL